jgi:hypothetical protein
LNDEKLDAPAAPTLRYRADSVRFMGVVTVMMRIMLRTWL